MDSPLAVEVQRIGARIGQIERWHGPRDPRLPELRRQLAYAKNQLHIQKVVDAAPPLTPEQRRQLRLLLSGQASEADVEPMDAA